MNGERQKPVSAKRLQEFIDNGFLACKNDDERRNYHRNSTLVDFKFIPDHIRTTILEAFEVKPKGSKQAIMNYLIKNRCRILLEEVEEF
jgi:hypothetical protein